MKIDTVKLDIALAKRCRTFSTLRSGISPQTIQKMRQGEDVRPDVIGRVARILDIEVTDIIKEART